MQASNGLGFGLNTSGRFFETPFGAETTELMGPPKEVRTNKIHWYEQSMAVQNFLIPYLTKTLRDTVEARNLMLLYTLKLQRKDTCQNLSKFFAPFLQPKINLAFLDLFFNFVPDYAFNPCRLLAVKLLKNEISIFLTTGLCTTDIA